MREREAELIDLHRRLVQVPSINRGDGSSADETLVAQVAGEYLRSAGGAGIEYRIVESAPGRGNLLARLRRGTSKNAKPEELDAKLDKLDSNPDEAQAKTLLWMGHSDVVPPGVASVWRFDPFSAEIADGRIWGRGTNDCKMLVAAELFAAAALAREGLPGRGELRIAIGADEEAGGRFGFEWLAKNETEFLRADLAINEGGGAFLFRGKAGKNLFALGCGEKGRYEVTLRIRGRGTHASVPWGTRNPLAIAGGIAQRFAEWIPPMSVASPIFENLREQFGLRDAASEANLDETIAEAKSISRAFANSLMAQSRATIVPTLLTAGEKTNAVPSEATLRCDARILPSQSPRLIKEALEKMLRDIDDVEISIEETAAPSVSPVTDNIVNLFEGALRRTFGGEDGTDSKENANDTDSSGGSGISIMPGFCTGFTDSRFSRSVGTPTYGFQVIEPGADPNRLGIHCIDESIEVGMLLPCSRALAHFAIDYLE